MRTVLYISVLTSCWLWGCGRHEVGAPCIVFEKHSVDFGEVLEGDQGVGVFRFRNTGTSTLILREVRTGCGCTVAEVSEPKVPPGGSGRIVATYDTFGGNGHVETELYVRTNALEAGAVNLKISGKILKLFDHTPVVDFGEIKRGESAEKHIVIRRLARRHLELSDITASQPWLHVEPYEKKEAQDEGSNIIWRKLCITLGKAPPVGPLHEYVEVSLLAESPTPHRRVRIPVTGCIKGDITWNPKTIFLGTLTQGESPIVEIRITGSSERELTVNEMQAMGNSLDIKGIQRMADHVCISVSPRADVPVGFVSDELVVQVNAKYVPEIRIPVLGRILPAENAVRVENQVKPTKAPPYSDKNGGNTI